MNAKLIEEFATADAREAAIRTAWKQARFTMYGLSLDLRQAELMQRVINGMCEALGEPKYGELDKEARGRDQ